MTKVITLLNKQAFSFEKTRLLIFNFICIIITNTFSFFVICWIFRLLAIVISSIDAELPLKDNKESICLVPLTVELFVWFDIKEIASVKEFKDLLFTGWLEQLSATQNGD